MPSSSPHAATSNITVADLARHFVYPSPETVVAHLMVDLRALRGRRRGRDICTNAAFRNCVMHELQRCDTLEQFLDRLLLALGQGCHHQLTLPQLRHAAEHVVDRFHHGGR